MKIQLAHHYWKNRENSVWNPSRFPRPEIEQEVKRTYSLLEEGRPKWRKYGDITVFFDYRPAKDVFGRDIVPISFAFVPGCIDPALCHKSLAEKLGKATVSQLELDVDFPDGCVVSFIKKYFWPFIGVACTILAFLVVWAFYGNEKAEKATYEKTNPDINSAVSKGEIVKSFEHVADNVGRNVPLDEKFALKSDTPSSFSGQNVELGRPENKSIRKDVKKERRQEQASVREWICSNPSAVFSGQNSDCAGTFVKGVCEGQIKTGTDFKTWADSGISEKCLRNRQWNVSKNVDRQVKIELNRIKSNESK